MPSLAGKTALVTGSTSGLGREVALRLGNLGAHVLVHGRDEERAREVVTEINGGSGSAEYYLADFSSLEEVRDVAAQVARDHPRIHLLINNAANYFGGPDAKRPVSEDGYESTFQVNYLAHYLLTESLLRVMRESAPARIINVSSRGQQPIKFDDIMLEHDYSPDYAYMQSKLAQILYTFHLAEALAGTGITANTLHPASMMNSPERVAEGAGAVMNLAVSMNLQDVTGLYFLGLEETRAHEQAYDERARQQLDALSRRLVGLAP